MTIVIGRGNHRVEYNLPHSSIIQRAGRKDREEFLSEIHSIIFGIQSKK